MSVNDSNGGIYARAETATAKTEDATPVTKTTTKAEPATTATTTTKNPTTTTPPSPLPTTTTAAPVVTSKAPTSAAVVPSSSIVSSSVKTSVPITTSSIPIVTSSSIVPSSSSLLLTSSSSLASITPTAVASASSSSSHTNLIGPIVGAVGGAALILGAGILFYRRRRSKREEDNADRTFNDYLASSDAAMRGRKSQQWTGGDNEYNRNSYMRSPASIAAGMYQQPSPRMVPAVGGIAAAQAAAWGSSNSQSPEHTVVGSPEQHQPSLYSNAAVGGYNSYNTGYGNNQYYQQPQYPPGQGYYQYNPDQYQQYGQEYQPYFDPATEQYVYPASAEYQQSISAEDYHHGQAPNTYDDNMPQQMAEQQRNYATSPLPAVPHSNTLSMASTVDEPRFPPNSPSQQNANMRGPSSPITSGDPHRTRTPNVSSAGQEPPSI